MSLVEIPQSAAGFLDKVHSHFINGAPIKASGSGRIEVRDPSTGAVISSIADASQSDVDDAVSSARQAFEAGGWGDIKPSARARFFNKNADLLEAKADEFAMLE